MEDLVLNAEAADADLYAIPVMIVGVRDAYTLTVDGVFEALSIDEASERISHQPHILVNRVLSARRLGLPRIIAFDVLELYAFVRPARFCLPTLSGLLSALTIAENIDSDDDACLAIQKIAERLLDDMASETYRYKEGALAVATMMARAGWPWGVFVMSALNQETTHSQKRERDGLAVWHLLDEWEDNIPPPPPGDDAVLPEQAKSRLKQILGDNAENREAQTRYAAAATHAFKPRELSDGANVQVLEAGTGTGKTLGYIAPASVWAEQNDAPVWLATYTKNLQRQLDQELSKLFPDPKIKAKRAVIRKGRENYACLLNVEETLRAVMMRAVAGGNNAPVIDSDKILMGLVVRWARYSHDGDMIGGDFPSWLGGHFGLGRIAGLTDRRSECLYSGCQHFRKCFIEKATRKAKHADLVVANHALVMAQAAMGGADPESPKRFVFDEGHHIFDAADSAFSTHLSGLEGAELRRWLRGKESGGSTRARGIKNRLEELVADDAEAQELIKAVISAAHVLPTDNWLGRVANAAASSRFETFLMKVREQVMARSDAMGPYGLEVSTADPVDGLVDAGVDLNEALLGLARPMLGLAAKLMNKLDEEADILDSAARGRLESSARSLKLRAEMVALWASMAEGIGKKIPDDFCDWFAVERFDGRERDIGMHRHFVDPSKPFAETVLEHAHGVVITSATLRDKAFKIEAEPEGRDEAWKSADSRVGLHHISVAPKRLMVPSPFDYQKQTKFLIVTDVNKMDADQVASAYRALFLASKGGALGLFTAISRLRATYERLIAPLDDVGIDLYGQHVDPIDTATLVDIFRENTDSCLLGTDAVRDGVDVPGNSLRLIVFDRVPWPRPTILHRARRAHFGGRHYDEMLTRLKISQAFGRLIRRENDQGVFVMLDGQTPSRILEGLPDGIEPVRLGLKDAVSLIINMQED